MCAAMGPQCPSTSLGCEGGSRACVEKQSTATVVAPSPEPPSRSLLERRRTVRRPTLTIEKKKSFDEVDRWLSEYKMYETLGTGSMGKVQRATRVSDGTEVALKSMRCPDEEALQAARLEYRFLLRLQHPNIIRALDFNLSGEHALLAMDYFNGASLDAAVQRHPNQFSEPVSQKFAQQLFSAVAHVHERGMIHRDIKPANMLVCLNSMRLMLIDFNVACDVADSSPLSPAGTKLYMAPEEIQGCASSTASDVWCAALCVFFMLSGRLPQKRDRSELSMQALERVAMKPVVFEGKPWEHKSETCKKFLAACLAIDEATRPMAHTAAEEEWLAVCEDTNGNYPVRVCIDKQFEQPRFAMAKDAIVKEDTDKANGPTLLQVLSTAVDKRAPSEPAKVFIAKEDAINANASAQIKVRPYTDYKPVPAPGKARENIAAESCCMQVRPYTDYKPVPAPGKARENIAAESCCMQAASKIRHVSFGIELSCSS